MQNYIGEKFLDKTYLGLYNSDIVTHTYHSNDKRYQAIGRYLERLERVHKKAISLGKTDLLYELYYKKYVIKKENIKDESNCDKIIASQRFSLKKWLDILFIELNDYPMWAKYYVFQGMLKMGSYDNETGLYLKRDKYTTSPFIPANIYVIKKCLDTIIRIVDKDTDLEINTTNFKKIYTYYEKQYEESIKSKSNNNNGVWVKYNQGSKENALELVKSIENKNTHWCTENECIAIGQLCGTYKDNGGDFYVYYTEDSDGKFTNPRIAICMYNHDVIGEIRGIDASQEMELSMLEPLEKKIEEMNFLKSSSKNESLMRIQRIKKLITLNKKISNNETITDEELIEFFSSSYGFGRKRHYLFNSILLYLKNHKELISREVLVKTARFSDAVFECIPDDLLKDDAFLLDIINQNVNVLRYISDELKDNPDFMLKAIKINKMAIHHISDKLKGKREFVMAASKRYSLVPKFENKKRFV